MKNRINDILENLGENLDVTNIYNKVEININKLKTHSTNDLRSDLKDLNYIWKKNPKTFKLETKNFDSVLKDKRLKDIDLVEKNSFFQTFLLWLKWRITLSWKPISIFNESVFFTKNFFRNLVLIFLVVSVFLFIDKSIIENRINSWYNKLISIKNNSWDINLVKKNINDAKLDFVIWNILFKPFLLIPNNNIQNWYNILLWWKNLTSLLDEWIQTYFVTKNFIDSKNWLDNIQLTNLLENLRPDFSKITVSLYNTIVAYEKIWELNDLNLNNKLLYAKTKLKESYKFLDIINRDFDVFLNLLWNSWERKYLILFQNNDEIRATWWFMWSLATVTIKNGKVTDFANDDIYAYEWEINKVYPDKNPAPEWLNKITDTFWLRDSNYFIDFESSSKSINFFLNKINKNIDGIIYINQNTILDFLKYTWWIEFPKLWETITEENFSLIISTLVESQAFKVWTLWSPKQVLFDFAQIFIWVLKEKKDYFAYLDILQKNIKSRDLVIYSFLPEENNLLWKLWLNWKINYSDTLDFSYPVYTSIWWNKSDRYIELKYKKDIIQNEDCSINTNLKIYRTHFFSKFEEIKVNDLIDKHPLKDKNRKDIINIQWKGENKAYVRVILPKDAIIEPKEWMKINSHSQATVVDFYMNTRLLESTHYDINYKLANKECKTYDFKFYKQPGIRNYNFEILNWENKTKVLWIDWDYILENIIK